MAELHDLDVLVPDDIVFKYRGYEYKISGDIPTETVFRLAKLFQGVSAEATVEQLEPVIAELKETLLQLFQEHDDTVEDLPFGFSGLRGIVSVLLEKLGFKVEAGGAGDPPATPARPGNRASRRSTGSRPS